MVTEQMCTCAVLHYINTSTTYKDSSTRESEAQP